MPTPNGFHLGGLRSLFDPRDHAFARHPVAAVRAMPVPDFIDHRDKLPEVWDQGQLGSCEAHGGPGAALPFWLPTMPTFMPSRLDAYARARLKGHIALSDDSGCYTRDMLKVMVEGLYDEKVFPYDEKQFATRPPDAERVFRISGYTKITDEDQLFAYLASEPAPCAPFSLELPDYFDDTGPTGEVKLYTGGKTIGGHCMAIVGAIRNTVPVPLAIVRNSWARSWADNGHCYIPLPMIFSRQLGGDVWALYKSNNL